MSNVKNIRFIHRPLWNDDNVPEGIPVDLPDRPKVQSILELMYNLEREIAAGGWDQPPILGLLYERSRKVVGGRTQLYLEFHGFPDFANLWRRTKRMHHAIVGVADRMRDFNALFASSGLKIAPDTLLATVLCHEAWTVHENLNTMTPEELRELHKAAEERRLHEHPDRVEVRGINAADRDGIRYGLLHERDSVVRHLIGRGWRTDQGVREGPTGDVPNSLHYLMQILMGWDVKPWAEWRKDHPYEDLDEQFESFRNTKAAG